MATRNRRLPGSKASKGWARPADLCGQSEVHPLRPHHQGGRGSGTEDFEPIAAATLRTANPYLAFARAIEISIPPRFTHPGFTRLRSSIPRATIGEGGAHRSLRRGRRRGGHRPRHHSVAPCGDLPQGPAWERIASFTPTPWCGKIAGWGTGSSCKTEPWWVRTGSDLPRKIAAPGIKSRRAAQWLLGDQVEVQANSCIDRASVGNTEIASGVKIDNLVQVGHGSTGGRKYPPLCPGGTGRLLGVGKNVVLAGQVGVVGHSFIGDGVVVTAQSGVPGDVAPGSMISGSPAFEHRRWMRSVAAFSRLPELVKQMHKKP